MTLSFLDDRGTGSRRCRSRLGSVAAVAAR